MSAPRKLTNVLEMNGSIKHDRKRYANRTTEPKPKGKLGGPAKSLPDELAKVWREVVHQVPIGVLTSADRIVVELTARLTLKMRQDVISTGETAQLISCLSRLGLSPADRSRVNVDPAIGRPLVPLSPFAQFAG